MGKLKSYKRPVVIYEEPTLDLPEFTDLVQSYKFRDGGVKKYETGGVDVEDVDGSTTDSPDYSDAWTEFLDKYPDYMFGGGEQFVRGSSGEWIINPNYLPEVPVGDLPDDFDVDEYMNKSKTELESKLNEINAFDQKWNRRGVYYGAAQNRGHRATDNPYAYSKLIGSYGLPMEVDHQMRNEMPTFHPKYNQGELDYHNQYYTDFMDQRYEYQQMSEEAARKRNAFHHNLLYGFVWDPLVNMPARAVTWGANKLFGDGSHEVDMRPMLFRNTYDQHGLLEDRNPTTAEVIPGHENRNAFANTALNIVSDPWTWVGGGGAYKSAPKITQSIIRNAPKSVAKGTIDVTKNTVKSNLSGIKKGYHQLLNKGTKEQAYMNPWMSRFAGTGNSLYYTSKMAALPGAIYSTGDFANRALFSKEGVTGQQALDTSFDLLDARLPFSSTIRDLYKGSVRDYQEGQFLSDKGIPYYVSGLSNPKNPIGMTFNAGAKGYRTLRGWWQNPFDADTDTRYQYTDPRLNLNTGG